MTSRGIRYCIIVLFCLPLAGCFWSDAALIDGSNADWPFKRASISMTGGDGQRRDYEVELHSSFYAVTSAPVEDASMKDGKILFHKIQNDLFIMQWKEPADPKFYYLVVNVTGNRFRMDICEGYKEETLSKFGMQRGDLRFCAIKNLVQLASLAKIPLDEPGKRFAVGEILQMER
jgi:hypothetical protein